MANRNKLGPARDCVECKLEEFFLTSWVNNDPAMVVGYEREKDGTYKKDGNGRFVTRARILMIRLMCITPISATRSASGTCMQGPKETMCSIYMHQWVEDKHDPSLALPGFTDDFTWYDLLVRGALQRVRQPESRAR